MRFIRGESLAEAIRRHHGPEGAGDAPDGGALALRKLLGRFLDVCDAVSYAHSRGVLHRDLKPSNILLGKFGETLVADWGLAKAMDRPDPATLDEERRLAPAQGSGSEPTLPGSAIGTPQYMSPEQAAGRLDLLGPPSDVYSLGATLYCLLTGRPPFSGVEIGSVLRDVQEGHFPRPREIKDAIDPALEAVCLKAMSRRPEDRYATPRLLAEDIERWLADEPVSAYPDPLSTRVGRWARRHRPVVVGCAVLLLTSVVGLAMSTALIRREQLRTEAQRGRTEENFLRARSAIREFLALAEADRSPEVRPLRKAILLAARGHYERFLRERGEDPSLRSALASTYFQVAEIILSIEEDRIAREGTGPDVVVAVGRSLEEARAYNREAIDLYERLVSREPSNERYKVSLNLCRNQRARMDSVVAVLARIPEETPSGGLGGALLGDPNALIMIGD